MSNITISKPTASTSVSRYDYETKLMNLSPEDKEKCRALTERIDMHDMSTLHEYGAELNSVVAENGDRLLSSVKADNGGEIVALTTDLLRELNMYDRY